MEKKPLKVLLFSITSKNKSRKLIHPSPRNLVNKKAEKIIKNTKITIRSSFENGKP